MKKLFTLLVLASTSLCATAQNGGKISGSIKDGGNQKIIDAASIALLKASDSSLIKTSVTDKQGNFIFENVVDGKYLVAASSVGHSKVFSHPLQISAENQDISTGVLQLQPASKNMSEVVVTAKKQFIERKIDKMILNPEALLSNAGTTALEVLEKAPGVTVDKDGNISLKGKQGVMVMLDGKPSYMTAGELANYLRSMASSSIDQIEIMTNPSAKYDAAGNSGIINIKTKKNKQKGFNGSAALAYGQGDYAKTNNSLNLNYRKNKLNLFSTLSGNYREDYQGLEIKRRYKYDDESTKAIFEQESFQKKYRNNYGGKVGLDYYASKKTTLGMVLSGYYSPSAERGFNTSFLKNSSGVVDSIVTANNIEDGVWKNGSINLNMRHILDSTGREITADVDYVNYLSDKDQLFTNSSFRPDWTKKSADMLEGTLPSDIKIYTAKVDYVHPFKSGLKMEAGVKTSFVTTDNTAGYVNIVDGVRSVDYEKTNRFQYEENINAGYINFSRTVKKWGFQTGLRVENTVYEGNQFGNPQRADSAFKNSYTSAFPTAYVSYNADKHHSFGLSYGRRINRPNYEDLNPFLFFLDKYTYGSGNPFLKPMFSNVLEGSHTYKQWLTTTVNYSQTKDLFNETFEQKGFATIVREGNYGKMNNASVSVNAQLKPAKWWTSMIYTEGRYQRFRGILYGEELDVDATNYLVNVNNQFTFKNGWGAELSGFYRTKGIDGQIEIKSLGQVNAGIQKQVLKKKGTVKLTVRDIFFTMAPSGNINFQNTEAYFRNTRDSRVATISFNYRFGKPIKGLKTRKTGGAGDEQNRVKGAN
jgi:outer membrane receptor protein involved in Fe transport